MFLDNGNNFVRNKKKIFNISADQNKLIKSIKKICKTISINDDVETVRSYSADWRGRFSNLALCVAFPKSSNEVSKLVKLCNKKNLPVIPQGGNTGLVCGTMPTKNKKEITVITIFDREKAIAPALLIKN